MKMNLEKKFGRYALKNLPLIMIICYVIGYVLMFIDRQNIILNFICLNPYRIIFKGQVWRLVTWVLIPPSSFGFFTIIMLFFYYSIAGTLNQVWGNYKFNVYIFSGMLFTILGSFVLMGLIYMFPEFCLKQLSVGGIALSSIMAENGTVTTNVAADGYIVDSILQICGVYKFSTFYINMSIFLAFASTFPDNRVLFMFFIPIKIMWLGIAYGAILLVQVFMGDIFDKVVIIASLLNFGIFFLLFRRSMNRTIKDKIKQSMRKREFDRRMQDAMSGTASGTYGSGISKHRCAICGRTELDNPDLQFRFCSKCKGNYEYCNDHLFSHTHVE